MTDTQRTDSGRTIVTKRQFAALLAERRTQRTGEKRSRTAVQFGAFRQLSREGAIVEKFGAK